MHLTNTYRKPDISSRAELVGVIADGQVQFLKTLFIGRRRAFGRPPVEGVEISGLDDEWAPGRLQGTGVDREALSVIGRPEFGLPS